MDMKLSDKTIDLLENFSSINQSILVKKGTKLRTISVMKNILAEAEVDENFEKDFGIYDLPQFLNGVGLMNDPDIDLKNDSYMIIREGKTTKVKFAFADPEVIITPPEKPISLPTDRCMLPTGERTTSETAEGILCLSVARSCCHR